MSLTCPPQAGTPLLAAIKNLYPVRLQRGSSFYRSFFYKTVIRGMDYTLLLSAGLL